ncbi:hypothetical protein JL720_7151 [Aureococcus anophagefferens]|nr:hypothetical protein JL720_7151 [Aureococcus anophagefferens]
MDGSQEMRARLLSSGEEDNRSSDSEDLEGGRPVVPRPLPSLARAVRGRRYPKRPARRRSNSDRAEDSVRRVSVYCLGDGVDCDELLRRLEAGDVRRPRGPWVDTALDCAVHSASSRRPATRRRRRALVRWSRRAAEPRAPRRRRGRGPTRRPPATRGPPGRRSGPGLGRPRAAAVAEAPAAAIIGGEASEKEATDGERDGAAAPPRRASERHVFVFGFGCVVTWGFDRAVERELVLGDPAVRAGATSAAERVEAHDTLTYVAEAPGVRGKRRGASFANDVIRLDGGDPLEKFTLAYALAQSAKLFVWEARVDVTIEDVRPIPERLAATGRTNLSETQISRMIGKIFTESTQVNLHSEILDSPNWLWEDDQHEPAYIALRDHLDVPDRVELLNKRLDILKELLEVLNTQLANSHSSRLEIIVIWLIIAEIVVTLLVFVLEHVLPKKFF